VSAWTLATSGPWIRAIGTARRLADSARIGVDPSKEVPLVIYRLLADGVVVAHLLFIVFVALGSLLVWRWRPLLWFHVPVVAWSAAIVMIGFTCPLTPLEKHLRARAGAGAYDGGFIDHYLDGVVYPGRFTALARLLVAALIVVGYVGMLARRRRGRPVVDER
jgi:Protein of Unknown function (DUF2784)